MASVTTWWCRRTGCPVFVDTLAVTSHHLSFFPVVFRYALASRRMKFRAIRFASSRVAGRRLSEYFRVRNRSPPLQLALSCRARISTASSSLRLSCLADDFPLLAPRGVPPRASMSTSRTSTARPAVIR